MDSNGDKQPAAQEQETPAAPDTEGNAAASGEKVEVRPVELSPIEEASPQTARSDDSELNLKMIMDIPVDIMVELGNTKISIREVLKLGPGSIIELDRPAGSPADIIVNGKLIGQGDVVIIDENFGIRITKLVGPEERIESL